MMRDLRYGLMTDIISTALFAITEMFLKIG